MNDVQYFKDKVRGVLQTYDQRLLKAQTSNTIRLTVHCPASNCPYIIAIARQGIGSTWKVTQANRLHRCGQNSLQPTDQPSSQLSSQPTVPLLQGRKRALPYRVYVAEHKELAAWTAAQGTKRSPQSLLNTANMAGAAITKHQAKKHAKQNLPEGSVAECIKQVAELPSYVRLLQEQDPEGRYYLDLQDLHDYDYLDEINRPYVKLGQQRLRGATMARRYFFLPSR